MRLALLATLALGCASTTEVPLDQPFALQYGQTTGVSSTGLSITLADVTDSRCPSNVTCVWEGEAIVHLRLNGDAVNVKVPGSVSAAGYVIEVRELTPYPSHPPPAKKEYSATIVVTRAGA